MTDEQPEPWVMELLKEALDAGDIDLTTGFCAAALALQRAFAEREADLVGAAKHLADVADSKMASIRETAEAVIRVRAALKSREAGHAQ